MTLFTVGHGTRSVEELVAVLRDGGVGRLVDVRRFPGSRRHPHLARGNLERELPAHEVTYEWREELGGRRSPVAGSRHTAWRNEAFAGYADHMDTEVFRQSLRALLVERPLAVMCAETLWWRCHRRLIADAATLLGMEVVHLVDVGKTEPHRLHPDVRADDDGWPVYDRGQAMLPNGSCM